MKLGFARLQATWRARKLTKDYRKMRRRIYLFQTRCRGMLTRRAFKRRLSCIIRIQCGFRKVLAIHKVREMREEVNLLLMISMYTLQLYIMLVRNVDVKMLREYDVKKKRG